MCACVCVRIKLQAVIMLLPSYLNLSHNLTMLLGTIPQCVSSEYYEQTRVLLEPIFAELGAADHTVACLVPRCLLCMTS